jgi:PQQ-dependent dehydrogenase (methanol/ethanol family)
MRLLVLSLIAMALPAQEIPARFRQACASCHGEAARGAERGPSLVDTRSLRSKSTAEIQQIIRRGVPGAMPPSSLPDAETEVLARAVRSWNASAGEAHPSGDVAAGEQVFQKQCLRCHTVRGEGGALGPDLSAIGSALTLNELRQSLQDPASRRGQRNSASCPGWAFCPEEAWSVWRVTKKDGTVLRGYARSYGAHDLQLQTYDGNIHLLNAKDLVKREAETASAMPAFQGSPAELQNLLAYLSRLDGVRTGPLQRAAAATEEQLRRVHFPNSGDWPGYHGKPSGNRHSELKQIDTSNVNGLQAAWTYALPHPSLQTTPLAMDGVLYVTGPNQVSALDGSTGREIWRWTRPRALPAKISDDAAKGAQRGAALLGDRIFFATDDAHLVALHRITGALLWQVSMPEPGAPGSYGATAAPLLAGNLVISGVGGGDAPLLGFLAAYDAATGAEVWRFRTIPRAGEAAAATWKGKAMATGGGATWLTGSYDPEAKTLYWPTGNPYPDTDGREREGDNLYTNCVLALDAATGKLKWHFQFTPHDLWDWDATEPLVLVDAEWRGRQRKLLLQANRNGFFYVLDRSTGEFLLGKPFVQRLTWASGLTLKGRPIVDEKSKPSAAGVVACPAVRGATNWYSTAWHPETKLFYVMAVEDCNLYRQAGSWFVPYSDPKNPPRKVLRALDIETGEIRWEQEQPGAPESNYSGVLSTAGGLLFFGEGGGDFAAADARSGKVLWHFPTGQVWKASPMTYQVNGRQFVSIAAGGQIFGFALAGEVSMK